MPWVELQTSRVGDGGSVHRHDYVFGLFLERHLQSWNARGERRKRFGRPPLAVLARGGVCIVFGPLVVCARFEELTELLAALGDEQKSTDSRIESVAPFELFDRAREIGRLDQAFGRPIGRIGLLHVSSRW